MSELLSLTVNGERKEVPSGTSIQALLEQFGIASDKVAVERNRGIAPRSSFAEQLLAEGDELEIVRFVGGG